MVLWSNWMLIINEWQLFIQSVSELAESTLDCWPGSEGWGSRWDRESTWDCRRQSHQHECSPLWSAPTTVRAIMPPFNAQCNQRQKWVKFAQDNQPAAAKCSSACLLLLFTIIRLHHYSEHNTQTTVNDSAWSVCLSVCLLVMTLQKLTNRSRCCLGWYRGAQRTMYLMRTQVPTLKWAI